MKKIKLFRGDSTTRVQEKVDKWLEKNPSFDVESTSITSIGDYGSFMLSVVYKDSKAVLSLNS